MAATRRGDGPGRALLGLVPFLAYTGAFLLVPAVSVMVGAFRDDRGAPTLANLRTSMTGVYLTSFQRSLELSALTALIGAVLGTLLAQVVLGSPRRGILRHVVSSASGVFANLGGVPLAFMFIGTVGSYGLLTQWLAHAGIDLYAQGFTLFSFTGIALVYVYFQVPLMVIVITPALEGLRVQWAEAAVNLGATRAQYWRYVAGPVLAPAFLGGLLLLFANAFAAYATAAALTSGTIPLVPLQIGSLLSGNVLTGQENLGKALGFDMIVVVGLVMAGYGLLQRRSSRWLRR